MKRITVQLIDDLDGSEIPEGHGGTVSFALDGENFEIALNNTHAQALRDLLTPYVHTARRATARPGRAPQRKGTTPKAELQAIREWAAAASLAVPSRGRIPLALRDAYLKAQQE